MAIEKRLIWTDDVMAFLCKRCNEMYSDEPCEPSDCLMLEELEKCPTVDAVEVVHGRWLFDSNTERYFCSVCNEQALYTSRDVPEYDYDWEENLRYSHTETIIEEHLTNYCPNCGANMRGSEE